MLLSGPGRSTGLSATSTVPSDAGECGRRPAMSRSTVDLPQPDGPRMETNSPLSATSGTEKVTSRITVTLPKRFVTPLKSTTFGRADSGSRVSVTSLLGRVIGEQPPLEPEQQPIDAVGQHSDDDED